MDIKEEYINNLGNEIKRLKKENRNTIKLTVNYDNCIYEIDTQIPQKYKEGDILYLPDSYDNPSKVKFLEYIVENTIGANFILVCNVLNLKKNEFENYYAKNLFKSNSKASDEYLARKYK